MLVIHEITGEGMKAAEKFDFFSLTEAIFLLTLSINVEGLRSTPSYP